MKDSEGNPVRITAADIRKGVNLKETNQKTLNKQIRDALMNNQKLQGIAIMSFAGKMWMQTDAWVKYNAENPGAVTQDTLNQFIEQATDEEKAEVGRVLGVDNWNTATVDDVNEAFRKNADTILKAVDSANAAKEMAKGETGSAPKRFTKATKDGAYDLGDGYVVVKSGDSYRVYNEQKDTVTRELSARDVNALMNQNVQETAQNEENETVAKADEVARRVVPDYDKLSESVKRSVRMTIRQAAEYKVSTTDMELSAKLSAKSGLNIVFSRDALALNKRDSKGNLLYANGQYNMRNTIYLNPDLSQIGKTGNIMLHELGHWLFNNGANKMAMLNYATAALEDSKYNKVVKQYVDFYKSMGETEEQYAEKVFDEIQAAYAEELMTDDDFWNKLLADDPKLNRRVPAFMRKWADRMDMKQAKTAAEAYSKIYQDAFRRLSSMNQGSNAFEYSKKKDGSTEFRMSLASYFATGRKDLYKYLVNQYGKDDAKQTIEAFDDIARVAQNMIKNNPDLQLFSNWSDTNIEFDENGHPIFSTSVKNGEYELNQDFSRVCKKRRHLDMVLNYLATNDNFRAENLKKSDFLKINRAIKAHGFEIACDLCFVDAKRYRQAEWAKTFTETYNDILKSVIVGDTSNFDFINGVMPSDDGVQIDPNKPVTFRKWEEGRVKETVHYDSLDDLIKNEGNANDVNIAKLIRDNPELRHWFVAKDIISSNGFDNIQRANQKLRGILDGWGGSSVPKPSAGDTVYDNSVLLQGKYKPETAFAMGGMRMNSFSDFMAHMFFDYCQAFADAEAKGLPIQAYTKELLFIRLYGKTGGKFNMSGIPAVMEGLSEKNEAQSAGLDIRRLAEHLGKDINEVTEQEILDNLDYCDYVWAKESINMDNAILLQSGILYDRLTSTQKRKALNAIREGNFDQAFAIAGEENVDREYAKHCGTIVVGVSKAHILKLLRDNTIRMVIPYHKSGLNPEIAKLMHISAYADYTKKQNTSSLKKGKDKAISLTSKKIPAKYKIKDFDFYEFFGKTIDGVLYDGKRTAQAYLDWCDKGRFDKSLNKYVYDLTDGGLITADELHKEYRVVPKFEEFRREENYYKVLEDFDVYDTITNKHSPQEAIHFLQNGSALPEDYKKILLDALKAEQKDITDFEDELYNNVNGLQDEIMKISKKAFVASEATNKRLSLPETDSQGNEMSEAQREFFKDSKVVDENGKLMPMYHHTENQFTKFDLSKARRSMDIQGFYFYPDNVSGEEYGSRSMKVYLNITNPYVVRNSEDAKKVSIDYSQDDGGVAVREALEAEGYDGVIFTEEYFGTAAEYIAFRPEQIKYVTNRAPTYDEDVRFDLPENFKPGEDVDAKSVTEEEVRTLLDMAMTDFDRSTYVPIRINTPEILIRKAKEKLGIVVKNVPTVMAVDKIRQAKTDGPYVSRSGKKLRGHNLSNDDIINIIKAMDDPLYIIYQQDGKNAWRFVEVVSINKGKKKHFATISVNENVNKAVLNGYKGGTYSVEVTMFEGDSGYLKSMLDISTNKVIYKKQKETNQRFAPYSGRSHDSSPFATSIPQSSDLSSDLKENLGEGTDFSEGMFSLAEDYNPKNTIEVYKLMRLKDGKLYPLFIDQASPIELGKWYKADSPNLEVLQRIPSGTYLVDFENQSYQSLDEYLQERDLPSRAKPTAEMVDEATAERKRWMVIRDTDRAQRRFGGEKRSYWNLGVTESAKNGKTTRKVEEYSMRPGWHAGSLPSMQQIPNTDADRVFVWVKGEMPADINYQEEADRNPDHDIPTHIPEDGYYMKATNANKKAAQADRIGWYVAGAFKPNEIISYAQAREVIDEWNAEHPNEPVEYDFDRLHGGDYNPLTGKVEGGSFDGRYSIPEDELKEAKRLKKNAEAQSARATERLQKSKEIVKENTLMNKLTNLVLDEATKAKEYISKRKYVPSSALDNPMLDAWEKQLGKIKYRSDLRKASARAILASYSKFYNEQNSVLADYFKANETTFDPNVLGALQLLNNNLNDKDINYKPLNLEEMKAAAVIVGAANALFRNFDSVIIDGKRAQTQEVATEAIDILKSVPPSEAKRLVKVQTEAQHGLKNAVDPRAVIKSLDHYEENGVLTRLYKGMTDGETAANKQYIDFIKPFEDFLKTHKKYGKRLTNTKITLKIASGDIQLPVGQVIALYELTQREQAQRGLIYSGISYRDDNGLVKNAKLTMTDPDAKLTEEDIEKISAEIRQEVAQHLTDEDMEFISIVENFFNKQSKAVKEAADYEQHGYTNVIEGFYYPIKRSESTIATSFSNVKNLMSDIAAMNTFSFNKDTVEYAKTQIFLNGVYDTIQQHARLLSIYAHMYKYLEAFSRVMNRNVGTSTDVVSVRKYLQEHVWPEAEDYLKKLMASIQGVKEVKFGDKAFEGIRGNFAKAQLGANPKVVFSQVASYPTAAIRLGVGSLLYGITHKINFKEMDQYSDWAYVRNYEKAIVKAESITDKIGKIGDKATKLIQMTDRLTIGALWNACQHNVSVTQGLAIGTEENKKAAAKLLEEVGRDTQPNYTNTERSGWMRGNLLARSFTMFSSAQNKQLSRCVEAAGAYTVARKTGDKAKIGKAGKQLARAIASCVVSNMFYCLIGLFFKWLFRKKRKNKEGEEIGFVEDYALDLFGTTIGALPVVKNVFDYFTKGYDLSGFEYDVLNDLLKSTSDIGELVGKIMAGEPIERSTLTAGLRSSVYAASQLLGIPTRNVMNTVVGTVKRVSPEAGYSMEDFLYGSDYRKDFSQYVSEGNKDMANYLLDLYTTDTTGKMSQLARETLLNLYTQGYDVLPKSIGNKISYSYKDENGDTQTESFTLNAQQKKQFKAIYSEATPVIEAMLDSKEFQKLSEENQAKAIRSVNNAYYIKAKNDVTETATANSLLMYFPKDTGKYATILAGLSDVTADIDKKGNVINGTKKQNVYKYLTGNGLTKNEALYVMAVKGYSLKNLPVSEANARKMLLKYILSLPVSQSEKAAIAEHCGFTVKGNRIISKNG
ncbi:MAG: hypothetical protein IJT60_05665 [Clostridia bacterium]|nr:hypothetical protein [Clostridia bacterium]